MNSPIQIDGTATPAVDAGGQIGRSSDGSPIVVKKQALPAVVCVAFDAAGAAQFAEFLEAALDGRLALFLGREGRLRNDHVGLRRFPRTRNGIVVGSIHV